MLKFGTYSVFYRADGYTSDTTVRATSKEDAEQRVLKTSPTALEVTGVITVKEPT